MINVSSSSLPYQLWKSVGVDRVPEYDAWCGFLYNDLDDC